MAGSQHEIYTIFCLIVGDDSPFPIDIAKGETVGHLKKMIKEEKHKTFANTEADQLKLYHVELADNDQLVENVKNATLGIPLRATKRLASISDGTFKEDIVHIIVKPPESALITSLKRGPSEEASDVLGPLAKMTIHRKQDITMQLLEKWSRPVSAPNMPTLHAYLQQPLAEDEKIPISQKAFDKLSANPFSAASPEAALNADQLSTLFRVSTSEHAPGLKPRFVEPINYVPPSSGTEDLFHYTYEENVGRVLKLILSETGSIRNSNQNTSTGLKRPDYGLLFKNSCVLRGEEKGSEGTGDPRRELLDKLIWTYGHLLYVFGYHAIATDINFVAITKPPSGAVHLFSHNLSFKKERVANLVHLIRLGGVVAWLGQQLHYRNRPEFVEFEREGGLVRMSIGGVVRKEFRHPDAVARVSKLIEIYKLLKLKQVPNVDTLDRAKTQELYPHVQLSPVGYDVLPESGSDSLDAVVCVLQALKAMHSIPNPVYHRDIREPNIIKRFDGKGWFLIDWSDASTTPTRAATHMKESQHSPMVRQDDHGAEVDIWGVGKYMESLASRVTCGIAKPDAVKQMARRWITDLATNAGAALDEINENQSLFTGEV